MDALCTYERVTPRQELQVAQILSNPIMVSSTPPQEHANISKEFSVTPEQESFLENIPMHAYDEFSVDLWINLSSLIHLNFCDYDYTITYMYSSQFLKFSAFIHLTITV